MDLSVYICSTNITLLQFTHRSTFLTLYLNCIVCNIGMFRIPEEHQVAIQEYFRTSVCSDFDQVQSGHPNLPALRKLIMAICKNLNR